MLDLKVVKNIVTDLLKSTSNNIRKAFYKDIAYKERLKGVNDFQTFVDINVEEVIFQKLSDAFPEWGFMGEEYIKENETHEYLWILDPICSTNNFVFGIPLFGTALGLLRNGEVIFAIIYLPIFNDLLWAIKDEGTFLNDRQIGVSKREKLKEAMILYDNQFYKSEKMLPNLLKLSDKCFTMRITGSAAYDMFSVASGLADARIFHKTKCYDFFPASLLIEESGGRITNFDGKKVSINDVEVLASNGAIHNEILEIINKE